MDLFNNILNCIGIIVISIGIVFIYDARSLTEKFFSTTDINRSTKTLKIVGFVMSIIGSSVFLI